MNREETIKELERYVIERDKAVADLDLKTFKKWVISQNLPRIPSDEVLEISMMKMAVHITSLDVDTRVKAFRWLLEHHYDFSFDEVSDI